MSLSLLSDAQRRRGPARRLVESPPWPRPATEVDAGGRAVRVSSPDRVIYEATERTAEVTKLMVVEYYVVGRRRHHAGAARPADGAGALAQGRPRGHRAEHRVRRQGDAFYQKRVPKGAPDYVETATITFPSGRTADEVCPTELAVAGVGGADGHADLPPVAGTPRPTRPPRRAADRPRPAPARPTSATRSASPAWPGSCSTTSAWWASPRPAATAACTSTSASSRGGTSSTCGTPRSRSAASSSAAPHGVTTNWWKEERGDAIFVDYNQNARDRTIASAYSLRPKPGAPVSHADGVGRARRGRATRRTSTSSPCRSGSPSAATCTPPSTTSHCDLSRCSTCSSEQGVRCELPYPPDYPKMPGEPPRVQPSKKVAAHWDELRRLRRRRRRRLAWPPTGLHSTAPLTRVWARVTFQPSARRTMFEMSNTGALRQPVRP